MTENRKQQIELLWSTMSDELRWRALPDLQEEIPQLIVYLDNDDTFVCHKDLDAEIFMLQFDEFIGWKDGVITLLKAFNIKSEPV